MSNNHQIEAHIYFGKILRGWDAYEGYKYFHPDTELTEEEYYSLVENLRYKPGQVVPAAGSNTQADVFNAALYKSPVDSAVKPGVNSHAENIGTFAGGEGAHAENIGTLAMAYGSHAEGCNTEVQAAAKFGHVGGNGSTVESEAGFAHGVNAVSRNRAEAVFGKNNEPDSTGKSVFQVGIGENKKHPKTGFQVDSDGTVWIINTNTGSRISLQSWLNDIQLKKIVVDQLPETGAPSTVYLLRVTAPDESRHNFFEEYIYVDGAWEMLGTSDTDESIIERILSNPAFKVDSIQIADKAIQTKHLSDGCVTADAIQDGAIGNEKIADGTISRDILTPEVREELDNLRTDFIGIQGIANTANRRADEAYTRGDLAYADAQTALSRVNQTDKTVTKLQTDLTFEVYNRTTEDNKIRNDFQDKFDKVYDKISDVQKSLTSYVDEVNDSAIHATPQVLAEAQQEQAFENLGIKTVFVDYATEIGVTLSEERIEEIINAYQVVIETPEIGKLVLPRTNLDSLYCYFQLLYAADKVYRITVTRSQRHLSTYIHLLSDSYAVKFASAQTLPDDKKKIARTNIGAQKELSVESKTNGDISIQGLGDAPVDLVPSERLAPYVLKLIASADAPGSYTLEGTSEELEATAQSIASNPHARVYLDCSIVADVPTPIPMTIILSDAKGGLVYLEADPYIYDGMVQYGNTPQLDISVIVSIGPDLQQVIVRKSVSEGIKKRLFIDLWNEACGEHGTYNHNTGFFELNGLTDITYEQALEIYVKWTNSTCIREAYLGANIRTNIPHPLQDGIVANKSFYLCKMEVCNLSYLNPIFVRGSIGEMFRNCINLERVIGAIYYSSADTLFYTGSKLKEIRIVNAGADMWLESPVLSFDSLDYLVNHRLYLHIPATVTVHADVYAKLTGDTTNAAAAALTPEELAQWTALVERAAENNTTFATK